MDIKIDAVFSLAKDSKDGSKPDRTSPPDRVVVKEEVHDPGYDKALHREVRNQNHPEFDMENQGMDVKPFQDMDLPPSLSMEKDTGAFRAMINDSGWECMLPPILEPETASYPEIDMNTNGSNSQTTNPKKKPCMQILPCYIVLTKVDRQLKSRSSLSYRAFRKGNRECLNICKMVHFRRKLKNGLDVFNVKAPSKKSGYKAYLDLRKSPSKQLRSKLSPKADMLFKDLIRKYAKTVNGRGAGRVMRSVNCLPKDFTKGTKRSPKGLTLTKLLTEAKHHVLTETEKEILFKRDLAKLKRQVAFQRSVMKTRKDHRKQQPEKNPTYFKSGTSVVSGRVRKTNTRYGNDFAMTKDEEVYFQSLFMINENLKKETKKIMKETEEDIYTDKRVHVIDSKARIPEVFVNTDRIDKPLQPHEDNNAIHTELPFERRERINARRREIRRQKAAQRVFNETKDGVIIKEMPNELGALTNLLLEGDNTDTVSVNSGKQKAIKTERMETDEEEKQYSFAKSIIKRSSDGAPVSSQTPIPPMVCIQYLDTTNRPQHTADSNRTNTTESSIDEERAQLLRIPEKVRRLFVKKKPEASNPFTESVAHGNSVLTDKNSVNGTGQVPVSIVYPVTKTTNSCMPEVSQPPGLFQRNKQTFIITPNGLVKPLCQVWEDIPQQGTSLPAARQLLTQSLSNSSTVSDTAMPIAIMGTQDQDLGKLQSLLPKEKGPRKLQSTVSNASKLLAPPVSLTTGRPLSTLPLSKSEKYSGSTAPVTVRVSQGGGVRSSTTFQPIRPANPIPNTGSNVLYEVRMAGKTLLIPASSITSQQNSFLATQVKQIVQVGTTSGTAATANDSVVTSQQGNALNAFTSVYSQALSTTTASSTVAGQSKNKFITVVPKPTVGSLVLPQTDQSQHSLVKPSESKDCSSKIKFPVSWNKSPPALGSRNSHILGSTGGQAASTDRKAVIRVVPTQDTNVGVSSTAAATHINVRSLLSQSFTIVPSNATQGNTSCHTSTAVTLAKSSNPVRFTLVPVSTSPPVVSSQVRTALSNSLKRPTSTVPSVVVMRAPAVSSSGAPNQQASSLAMQTMSSQYSLAMPSFSLLGGSSTISTASNNTMVTRSTPVQVVTLTNIKQERSIEALPDPWMVQKQEEKCVESEVPSKVNVAKTDRVDPSVVYNGDDNENASSVTVEDETQSPNKVEEKPLPFTEATTAREERLKKLKALLKERQMAVEKLQKERLNAESDGDHSKRRRNRGGYDK